MLSSRITIGDLDCRVDIQSPVVTTGSANSDIIDSWSDYATNVPAKVWDNRGYEVVEADRITHIQTTTITVRYDSGLRLTQRILFGGFAYRILGIGKNKGSRNGFLDITAELQD